MPQRNNMKLQFVFENINTGPNNKVPEIEIKLNSKSLYLGHVQELIHAEDLGQDSNLLEIAFLNKQFSDTKCDEHNNIVEDMNFSLQRIVIDNYDLEELIWQGQYVTPNNQTYSACLFFGPVGQFELRFDSPILKWILKSRHEKQQNDPNWEEDYNYYVNACILLNSL